VLITEDLVNCVLTVKLFHWAACPLSNILKIYAQIAINLVVTDSYREITSVTPKTAFVAGGDTITIQGTPMGVPFR
jgi:hypothetical protein